MAFLKANQSLQYWGNDSVFSICLAAYGSFGLHCFHLFRFLLTLHSSFQKCLNRTGTQYLILREFEWPAAQTQSSALPKACWTASVHVSQPKIPWAESVHAIGWFWHPIMATIFVHIHQKSMVTLGDTIILLNSNKCCSMLWVMKSRLIPWLVEMGVRFVPNFFQALQAEGKVGTEIVGTDSSNAGVRIWFKWFYHPGLRNQLFFCRSQTFWESWYGEKGFASFSIEKLKYQRVVLTN